MSKIKVLFVQSTLEKGGITNHLKLILNHLNLHLFEPEILCLSKENENTEISIFLNWGIPIHQLHTKRWMPDFMIVQQLAYKLKQINPHVIQTFTYRPTYFIGTYFSKQYHTIGVLSSNVIQNYATSYGPIIGGFIAKRELLGLAKMNKGVAVSNYLNTMYQSHCSLMSIKNGIDVSALVDYNCNQKLHYKSQLNWDLNLHYFVAIGNFNKVKNQELLIQSFIEASIAKTHRLVLIGDGPSLPKLKQKYAHNKEIIFEGYHSNVFKFLKAADAYVSASISEGMPLSVLEAMSVHLPCILSDIPAHVELMQDNNPVAIKCFSLSKPQELVYLFQNFKPTLIQYTFQTAAQMTLSYEKLYLEFASKNEPN